MKPRVNDPVDIPPDRPEFGLSGLFQLAAEKGKMLRSDEALQLPQHLRGG